MAEKGEKCWVILNDLEHTTVKPATIHRDIPEDSKTQVEFTQPNGEHIIRELDDHLVWFGEQDAWEEAYQRLRDAENDLKMRLEDVRERLSVVEDIQVKLEKGELDIPKDSPLDRGYFIPGDLVWAVLPDDVFRVQIHNLHLDMSASVRFWEDEKNKALFEIPITQLYCTREGALDYKLFRAPTKEAREEKAYGK